jgi:hypothetical protein
MTDPEGEASVIGNAAEVGEVEARGDETNIAIVERLLRL